MALLMNSSERDPKACSSFASFSFSKDSQQSASDIGCRSSRPFPGSVDWPMSAQTLPLPVHDKDFEFEFRLGSFNHQTSPPTTHFNRPASMLTARDVFGPSASSPPVVSADSPTAQARPGAQAVARSHSFVLLSTPAEMMKRYETNSPTFTAVKPVPRSATMHNVPTRVRPENEQLLNVLRQADTIHLRKQRDSLVLLNSIDFTDSKSPDPVAKQEAATTAAVPCAPPFLSHSRASTITSIASPCASRSGSGGRLSGGSAPLEFESQCLSPIPQSRHEDDGHAQWQSAHPFDPLPLQSSRKVTPSAAKTTGERPKVIIDTSVFDETKKPRRRGLFACCSSQH